MICGKDENRIRHIRIASADRPLGTCLPENGAPGRFVLLWCPQ